MIAGPSSPKVASPQSGFRSAEGKSRMVGGAPVVIKNAAAIHGKITVGTASTINTQGCKWASPSLATHAGNHVRLEPLTAHAHGQELYEISIEGTQAQQEDRFRFNPF